MSETTIERLDYSKPPPGYRTGCVGGISRNAGHFLFCDEHAWRDRGDIITRPNDAEGWPTDKDALAAAWAHYKAEHDPPGLRTAWSTGDAVTPLPLEALVDARAAAWAWHDRRHALSLRDHALHPRLRLPMNTYLAMSDADCEAGEKLLAANERRQGRA